MAVLAACGSERTPTEPTQRLIAVGHLERGAVVQMVAREGAPGSDSIVSRVAITPASAGTVSGTFIKFLKVGAVTITATAVDGRSLTTDVTVTAPPTVFFDAIASGNRDIYSVSLDGGDLKRWTTSPGEDVHPSVAGGIVVFSSTRDGNGELYSVTIAAGGTEKRLTTTTANESQPTLAMGGANLAFVSDASGAPRIHVGTAALTQPAARLTIATFGFDGSIEADPTWSPTGDRIAFVSTGNGRANLFISPSGAGSSPAFVVGSGPQQTDVEPAWSPDGTRLAFASTRGGGTLLHLLDLKTDVYTQVSRAAGTVGQPAWLPDGRLTYTQFSGGETTLWCLDLLAGSGPIEIPTGTRAPAHPTSVRP
jgi:TolB protein